MFPVYEPPAEITTTTGRKTFKFDFAAGDFPLKDGKAITVEGLEALKLRVEKVLKTEKFIFKVYESDGDEYGTSILEFLNSGNPQQYIQSEIEREITDVLTRDEDIIAVYDFVFSKVKRTLMVEFSVNTVYGEVVQFAI